MHSDLINHEFIGVTLAKYSLDTDFGTGSLNAFLARRTFPGRHLRSCPGCGSEKTVGSAAAPCGGVVASATSAGPAWSSGWSWPPTGACCRGDESWSSAGWPFWKASFLAFHKKGSQTEDLLCTETKENIIHQNHSNFQVLSIYIP